MGLIPSELSLDCRPTSAVVTSERCVPRTIGEFISQVSMMGSVNERVLKLDDYVKRLEEEMRKIDAFKRELPLCMLLLTDAVMALKVEVAKCEKLNTKPVLEEFIPLKKSCDEDESEDKVEIRKDKDSRDKMNWMSSVQLWSHENSSSRSDSNPKQIAKSDTKKRTLEEENRSLSEGFFKSSENRPLEKVFVPFKGCSIFPGSKVYDEELHSMNLLSLDSIGIKKTREDVGCSGNSTLVARPVSSSLPGGYQSGVRAVSQTQTSNSRKQRRCWSPELHRRFVEALHKLGGCQVATPKQIRELMQVDGLTNDEVKSHLQKYRLHTRRLPATANTRNDEPHVVLGGLWMSKDKHGELTKQSNSQSDSPQSPLQFCGATSMTGCDSMEDEEDEKSETHSWKSHVLA